MAKVRLQQAIYDLPIFPAALRPNLAFIDCGSVDMSVQACTDDVNSVVA